MIPNQDPKEILRKGEDFYFETLKEELEKEHFGEYVVVDVDVKKYIVHPNKITAVDMAREQFGHKLFYIVQIGDLDEPTVNFRERKNVAWIFSK